MDITLGTQIDTVFTVENPTTGALQDADSLPSGTVFKDGEVDTLSVTVAKKATGTYKASYQPTAAAGFAAGNDVACKISATCAGVSGGGIVRDDRIKDTGGSIVSQTNARNLLTAAYVSQYACPANKTATLYIHLANVETGSPADREVNVRLVPDGETPGDEHLILPEQLVKAAGDPDDHVGPIGPYTLVEGDEIWAKADITDDVQLRLEIFELAVPV